MKPTHARHGCSGLDRAQSRSGEPARAARRAAAFTEPTLPTGSTRASLRCASQAATSCWRLRLPVMISSAMCTSGAWSRSVTHDDPLRGSLKNLARTRWAARREKRRRGAARMTRDGVRRRETAVRRGLSPPWCFDDPSRRASSLASTPSAHDDATRSVASTARRASIAIVGCVQQQDGLIKANLPQNLVEKVWRRAFA